MLEFAWPWMIGTAILPWLVRRYAPAREAPRQVALSIPFLNQLPVKRGSGRQRAGNGAQILLWLAYALLVLASMRPQWLGTPLPVLGAGRDLMLAVDISGSMGQSDFVYNGEPLSRLRAVQRLSSEFLEQRQGDRAGLIVFADRAHLQTPLTFDLGTLRHFLQQVSIGLAGTQTALGDAIGLSLKHLADSPEASRVVILITDGANTAGRVSPEQAAELAQQLGVRIHTIGVGKSVDSGIFRQQGSGLDARALQMIAEQSGGQFFLAENTQALQGIYRLIDQLEPIDRERARFRPHRELYIWPLALALLLWLWRLWQERPRHG